LRNARHQGFTLIELSIVLVIIGLIVGAVLVGQDLIRAAEVRAQISQIEKYNTAVNTFRDKYGALPGDLPPMVATQFNFVPRAGTQGRGDGNGLLEGWAYSGAAYCWNAGGEPVLFWRDLNQAGLISEALDTAIDAPFSTPNVASYLPSAKINGNFIYVYSGSWAGIGTGASGNAGIAGTNFFAISQVPYIGDGGNNEAPGLTVSQASMLDTKVDDGLPQSGRVEAFYANVNGITWAMAGAGNAGPIPGTATAGSSSTCYDNGNNAASPMRYSMSQNGGANVNCAISFQFQ
jgi:prepilin-type N-terminal cleavage/methylation domain-containing protein